MNLVVLKKWLILLVLCKCGKSGAISFICGIFLKVAIEFVLSWKSYLKRVKKRINDARVELSCARLTRAGGEEVLAPVIFKLGKNSESSIYLIRHKLDKVRGLKGQSWAVLFLRKRPVYFYEEKKQNYISTKKIHSSY